MFGGGLASQRYGHLSLRDIIWDDKKGELGHGTFGRVFPGMLRARNGKTHSWPDTRVAVKVLLEAPETTQKQRLFIREVEVMANLRHPALCNYVMCSMGAQYIIVTELAKSNLQAAIDAEGSGIPLEWQTDDGVEFQWDSTRRTICAIGMTLGLAYIHKNGVIHRDLKPENVLLDDQMRPLIGDFGFSRFMPTDEELRQHVQMTMNLGTPLYMAPEVINPKDGQDDQYDHSVDVYSYAMMIYALVTTKQPFYDRKPPFASSFQIWQAVLRGERPTIPPEVSDTWREIMESCWLDEPKDRPTMEKIADRILQDPSAFYMDDTVDAQAVEDYLDWVKEAK